jgi:hypothetical protein
LVSLLTAAEAVAELEVELDHATGVAKPAGTISLRDDEVLVLKVANTSRQCFTFNLTEVEETRADLQAEKDPKVSFGDMVELRVTHREEVVAYEVEVKLKPNLSSELKTACSERSNITFKIPVDTYGWALAFAGAFTYDELTDPVFSLEVGVENPDAAPEMQRQGFFVRESPDEEDDFTLGAAAMVHLYHSDPERLRPFFLPESCQVNWAPLSFGLGISDQSEARYFVGTTLRFGKKMFLVIGGVFGARERLPNGLALGDFTTDANSLKTLGSKTDSALFVGLSYSFLNTGAAPFQNAFKEVKPAPEKKKKKKQDDGQQLGAKILDALNKDDAFKDIQGFDDLFKEDGERFCSVDLMDRPDDKVGVTVSVSAAALDNPDLMQQKDDTAKKGYKILENALKAKVTELLKAGSKELANFDLSTCS